MKEDQQVRLHKERWKTWNDERQRQNMRKKLNVEQGIQNYAANLIRKIGAPTSSQNDKKLKTVDNNLKKELESNICSICLDLMIPPNRQPIMLVPCGHNICKECLFVRPPHGLIQKNLALKLNKCSLCRVKIQSYALNQSLMALICMYSNNKQLLEKEQKRMEQQALLKQYNDTNEGLSQLKMRCDILQDEKNKLVRDGDKFNKQKNILNEVIDTLKKEKRNNERQMEKIEEQARLINKTLTKKLEDMELVQRKLKEIQDKQRVLDKALIPLKKEKEKQQMLQIARLIKKQ